MFSNVGHVPESPAGWGFAVTMGLIGTGAFATSFSLGYGVLAAVSVAFGMLAFMDAYLIAGALDELEASQ